MGNGIAIPIRGEEDRAPVQSKIALPPPRIWEPKHLAEFFGFTVHWVDKLMKSADPPPRCSGVGRRRFDTQSRTFREWLARRGVDIGES